MDAIITSVRKTDDTFLFSAITEKEKIVILSKEYFKPGSVVEVEGERMIKEVPEIEAKSVRELKKKRAEAAERKINKFIEENTRPNTTGPIFADKIIQKLEGELNKVAWMIKKAVFLNRPIIFRYHGDTDGVCAALAIYFSISVARNFKMILNRTPYYRTIDCQSDIYSLHTYDAEYMSPLLILIDFGASEESKDALRLAKKEGFEIAIIDHHPPSKDIKQFVDAFASPYAVGGSSDYVAGLLACEIAQRIVNVDLHDLYLIALAGDRSKLPWSLENHKDAIALDFIVSYSKTAQSIDAIAKLFLDKEYMSIAYTQAMEKQEQLRKRLLRKTKRKRIGKTEIFLIDTDGEYVEGEYPGRGEMASLVHDELTKGLQVPAMTIGHGKRSINMRVNKVGIEEGINSSILVENVKKELMDAVEAGGGHPSAAGIRVRKGFAKIVLNQLLKEIEKIK